MRPPPEPGQDLLWQVSGMIAGLTEVPRPRQRARGGNREDERKQVAPSPALDDLAAAAGSRAAVPARQDRAAARAGSLPRPARGFAAVPGAGCGDFVGILTTAAGACVIFVPRFLRFRRQED
ncbi:MAG: hypothetical protein ACRDP7_46705 [Trebonia sp.]